ECTYLSVHKRRLFSTDYLRGCLEIYATTLGKRKEVNANSLTVFFIITTESSPKILWGFPGHP
ncbi:MAG: hypothetical protein V4714_06415, partial [Bacteroidota bacterium]